MIFEGFEIGACPFIHRAFCKCGTRLEEVDNGMFSSAMFCPNCENVYTLQLRKIPKKNISEEFLEQSRAQIKTPKKSQEKS